MNIALRKNPGFTLLEMLLVLVIISSVLVMMLNLSTAKMDQFRREKTAMQMQAVMTAASAYFVANNTWPSVSTLQTAGYLPPGNIVTAWGNAISFTGSGQAGQVKATLTGTKATVNASIVAGLLPMATSSSGLITAYLTIPGQNLNNAMAVNYGAVYYSGSCVPQPNCPSGMVASLMVMPVAVTGIQGSPGGCTSAQDPNSCNSMSVSPVTSFRAFYTGASGSYGLSPPDCEITGNPNNVACIFPGGTTTAETNAASNYWRVCLEVVTTTGLSYPSSGDTYAYNEGKLMGNILAVTRCQPANGDTPSGSDATNFTPNLNWAR